MRTSPRVHAWLEPKDIHAKRCTECERKMTSLDGSFFKRCRTCRPVYASPTHKAVPASRIALPPMRRGPVSATGDSWWIGLGRTELQDTAKDLTPKMQAIGTVFSHPGYFGDPIS